MACELTAASCHRNFDDVMNPGLIFLPVDLQYFIDFQRAEGQLCPTYRRLFRCAFRQLQSRTVTLRPPISPLANGATPLTN
jgi:hypothetical protein